MYFNRMVKYYKAPVLRPLHGQRRRDRLGEGAVQRGALRPQRLRRRSSAQHVWYLIRDAINRGSRTARRPPARRSPQIHEYLKTFDVGSLRRRRRRELRRAGRLHRPLPDRPRRWRGDRRRSAQGIVRDLVAPLVRGRTRAIGSGGLPGVNAGRHGASVATGTFGNLGGASACGSATTRSSPRTAASACSRTSTPTTSGCPTSTTLGRAARRTRPGSGRSCPPARTSATADRTASATTPATSTPGRSSSSGG